jgi:DNA-directed RNA polymerase specialized sigma24 family protein
MDRPPRDHPLHETHPAFLDLLDSNPLGAWEEFYAFAVRFLRACPPRATAGWSREEREDLVSAVVLHCCRDEFRVLRRYRDVGRPFAAWLFLVARNKALDEIKRRRGRVFGEGEAEARAHSRVAVDPPADEVAGHRQTLEIALRCIEEMGDNCRLLLLGAAEGLSPRGLTAFLGWPPDWNKKASDALRECRRQLRARLKSRGVEPGAGFGDREGR